jgi:serine protease Do
MTVKRLILAISISLSVCLLAIGAASAQVATTPPAAAPEAVIAQQAPAAEPQQPSPPAAAAPEFSVFFDGGSFLGVYTEDINKENMNRYGLRDVRGVGVTEIVKASPAEKAGLHKDDVILRFDGENVTSTRKLNRLVSESAPDHTVRVTVSRGGSEQELSVTLAKRNDSQNVFGDWNGQVGQGPVFRTMPNGSLRIGQGGAWSLTPGEDGQVFSFGGGGRRIGITTEPLTKQLSDFFGVKDGGLLVTSVTENSPAAKAGLKAGDVITAVDGEKVESSGDITRAVNKRNDGEVTLTVVRDHSTRTLRVTPEKTPEVVRPRGTSARQVIIPRIEIPVVPAMDIQLPRIQTPRIDIQAIPQINVTIPRPIVKRIDLRNPI